MAYDSIDAINKDFGKRIKDTDSEDEKRSLALEQREAIADLKETQADARLLEAHLATALAQSGLPAEAHKFVRGTSAEEIDASVADVKATVASLTSAANDAAAKGQYGSAGAAGGAAAGTQVAPEVENIHDFEGRFNQAMLVPPTRTGSGNAPISVQEAEEYVRKIGAAPILDHLARNSARPAIRAIAQSYDLQTLKPKG